MVSADDLLRRLEAVPTTDLEELCAALSEVEGFDQLALAKQALAAGEAESTAATLGRVESLLGSALGSHVGSRYDELITEVGAVRSLEAELTRSHAQVERLAARVRRVRSATVGPHAALAERVAALGHIQQSAEMLRRVQRLMHLSRRLHEAVDASRGRATGGRGGDGGGGGGGDGGGGGVGVSNRMPPVRRVELSSSELPKAALAVVEAQSLLADGLLDGVSVTEPEAQFIRAMGAAVRKQAEAMLWEGMRGPSQPVLATALQTFFNLQCLRDKVLSAASDLASELRSAATAALTNVGARAERAGRAGWNESLWLQVDAICSSLLSCASRLSLLCRVLRHRRDPLSNAPLASLIQPHDHHTAGGGRPPAVGGAIPEGGTPAAGGAIPEGGTGVAAAGVCCLASLWPAADLSLLQAHPILGVFTAPPGGFTALTGTQAAGGGPAGRGEEGPVRQDGHGAPAGALPGTPPPGLQLLFRPVAEALCDSLVSCAAASSQLHVALTADLPRLLGTILSALDAGAAESAAPLPPDAAAELGAAALLPRIEPLLADFRRQRLAALFQACDELVAAVRRVGGSAEPIRSPGSGPGGSSVASPVSAARGAHDGGTPASGIAASSGCGSSQRGGAGSVASGVAAAEAATASLCRLASADLRRSAPVVPLLLVVARLVGQAVRMLAGKLEVAVVAAPAGGAGSRAWEAAEASNTAILGALLALRRQVLSDASALAGGSAAVVLRPALAALEPVAAALASPGTPMTESRREEAAGLLKQMLRAGMIDEDW